MSFFKGKVYILKKRKELLWDYKPHNNFDINCNVEIINWIIPSAINIFSLFFHVKPPFEPFKMTLLLTYS